MQMDMLPEIKTDDFSQLVAAAIEWEFDTLPEAPSLLLGPGQC